MTTSDILNDLIASRIKKKNKPEGTVIKISKEDWITLRGLRSGVKHLKSLPSNKANIIAIEKEEEQYNKLLRKITPGMAEEVRELFK